MDDLRTKRSSRNRKRSWAVLVTILVLASVSVLVWVSTPRTYRSEILQLSITLPGFWQVEEFERTGAVTFSPRLPKSQGYSVYVRVNGPLRVEPEFISGSDLVNLAIAELALYLRAEPQDIRIDTTPNQKEYSNPMFEEIHLEIPASMFRDDSPWKVLGHIEPVQPVTLLMWPNGQPYANQFAYIFLGADEELNEKAMRMMDSIKPLGTGE